jgi:hypothetical protein
VSDPRDNISGAMLWRKYRWGFVLLSVVWLRECPLEVHGMHGKRRRRWIHSSLPAAERKNAAARKRWISAVAIVEKRNRDFEYFSTIWRPLRGKAMAQSRSR